MLGIIESELLRLCYALLGSGLISYIAYRLKALSISGAASAFVMGVSFVFFAEPVWFILLLVFFVSSTFWSKFKKLSQRKKAAEGHYEKTGRRDGWQVFANGGIGMLLAIMSYFIHDDSLILLFFIMVMAIVNADTWATEIGGLSRKKPRHIVTGKIVEAGTSGGITLLGTLAALSGAATIGVVATLCTGQWSYFIAAILAGFIGCMLDSLLGATVQRMYRCTICENITERHMHCQKPTVDHSGISWFNNDIVNIIASVVGSGVVWLIYVVVM